MSIFDTATVWAIRPERMPAIAALLEARAAGDKTTADATLGRTQHDVDERMIALGGKWNGYAWTFGEPGAPPTLLPGTRPPAAQSHASTAANASSSRLSEARRQGAKFGVQFRGDAWGCAETWGWHVVVGPQVALEARLGLRGVQGFIEPGRRLIHVASELSPVERNKVLAHECAHALLHQTKSLAQRRQLGVADATEDAEAEVFAEAFIACRPKAGPAR